MSRELDEQCAALMGWTKYPVFLPNYVTYYSAPPFSTDYAAAHLLEDEIDRRGLRDEYLIALWKYIGSDGSPEKEWVFQDIWLFMHATPEQRAHAFIKVLSE